MIEGRSGGSGRGTRRELWPHLTAVLQPADRTLYRVPTLDPRRPTISVPPTLPHPRSGLLATGKNPAAPSARSARHWSPQNGGPKGKMIEGRSGGSGRGTRRELWAPPDSGSAQPADRTLYRVPTLDPRRPLISFPPPLPHPRTCLLATGKTSAAPERTFSSALVSAEWRAQRENDRREERGIWAGHSKRIVGPT